VKLSVVLSTYQRADLLRGQLEALATQEDDGPWELVVADNGSTDGTLDLVESYRPRVPELHVVVAAERRRPPYVLNAGAAAATGDALLFLNDDDLAAPGWRAAMRAALERHDVVAGRLDWELLNPPWPLGARGRKQHEALPTWWGGGEDRVYAAGGALGVKRAAHEAIGGFDEDFVAGEDVDYCWRLRRAGYALHFAPEAVVHVRARTTLLGVYRQARVWAEGDVLIYRKHRDHLKPFEKPFARGLAGWAGTFVLLTQARTKADLANVARHAGWRAGLIRGSVKHRTLMLSD
jgi:GT2 family glycosyltransferase